MKKRTLAILLSLAMVSGLLPQPVYAAVPEEISAVQAGEEPGDMEEDTGQPEEENALELGQEAPVTDETENTTPWGDTVDAPETENVPDESAKEAEKRIEVDRADGDDEHVAEITLDKDVIALTKDSEAVLTAIVSSENSETPTVEWRSSRDWIASVDENGRVYARDNFEGSCVITATIWAGSYWEKHAACIVHVNKEGAIKEIANDSEGNITWNIDGYGKLTVNGTGDIDMTGGSHWLGNCAEIMSADINVRDMVNASRFFMGCSNLKTVDLEDFDTSSVTDMHEMFYGCHNLTNLDLGSFITENVTDMHEMFSGCYSLASLDLGSFITENVTDMHRMFGECYNLASLDLGNFRTEKVTDMNFMFALCNSLTSLNISSFHTENVTNMSNMFSCCRNLASLDVSKFKTQNVIDMDAIFSSCENLAVLDVSGFDTGNVTNMRHMFSECHNLTDLDVSKFNTEKAENMEAMFAGCRSLTLLDVSGFKTRNVTNMNGMFLGCNNLVSLDVSKFDTENVTNVTDMFGACYNLAGILDLSSFNLQNANSVNTMLRSCNSLTQIETPVNLRFSVGLPSGTWYDESDTVFSKLPTELSCSVTLWKGGRPRLVAVKEKTSYYCGETLELDDLTVTYHRNKNNSENVTDFTTNAAEIDMSTDGEKELKITYKDLTATVIITVLQIPPVLPYSYLTAAKEKTSYYAGEALGLDDLTVTYHTDENNRENITDFTTNAAEIDMSAPGEKQLEITYKDLTATVTITVIQKTEDPDVTYKVIFDLQGRGSAIEEYESDTYTNVKKGSHIPKPTDPTAEGFIFKDWYKDETCTTPWNFDKDVVEADLTLYARWDAATYTVIFDLQDKGAMLAEYTSADYKNLARGSLVKEPANPSAEGFIFKGWYKEAACTTSWNFDKDIVENNLTLYAKWIEIKGQVLPEDMPDDGKVEDKLWVSYTKSVPYTGKAIKPTVRIYKNSSRLIEGLDYTVKYKNNTKACPESTGKSAPTAIVIFKGSYNGEQPMSLKFSITAVDLRDVTANNIVAVYKKNSKPQKKVPEVFLNNKKLVNKKDFTVFYPDSDFDGKEAYKDPGEYEIKIEPKSDNFTGEKIVKLTIVDPEASNSPTLMSKVKVGKIKPQLYTGKPVELAELNLTFKGKGMGTKKLERGRDYSVSYENNTDVGTAAVILEGMGEYIGTKRVTFKITACSLKEAERQRALRGLERDIEVALGADQSSVRPRLQLTFNGQKLVEGKDYTISYKNNKKAGSGRKAPTIIIKGKGNFKGTIHKRFTITETKS